MPKTIVTPPGAGTPIAPFSPGTMADGIVYVSGTLPFDKNNDVVHVGDIAAQTRHVLETIKSIVETAGGTMEDVTFNHIFLTDWAHYAAMNKVYADSSPAENRRAFAFSAASSSPMRWLRSPASPMWGATVRIAP
jgi:aminoacrylate peracid reductase